MKQTVNINLGGTFFHIDEDAFGKLQRYLDAIKKSLSDPQGSDEIIKDIEARISELFSEKIETNAQVISIKELDEVIAIMGQPEDYMVDEEIFEDAPAGPAAASHQRRDTTSHKQLYRDIDNKFVAGVSSGLAHYIGIDALWIRLLWILLTIATSGLFLLIYILFWILVPAAESTSEKLKMSGEAVNISSIERKMKEQLENAKEKVKQADYDKYGKQVKSGVSGFFDTVGKIIMTLIIIFVKFIGILLIFISLTTLVALIISLFTVGTVGFWGDNLIMDYFTMTDTTNTPIWLISLLSLFAIGIPFFALFILGLKMIVSNLKSIGSKAKIALLVVWFFSLIGIGIIAVKQVTESAFDGDNITEDVIPVQAGDILNLSMRSDSQYEYKTHRSGGLQLKYNDANEQIIYSNDIRLIIRSTTDSVGKIVIDRTAEGNTFLDARKRANAIEYNYTYENNNLLLDGFFITETVNKYRDQDIQIALYLPEGTILVADENTYSFHRNDSRYDDILNNGDEGQQLLIENGKTKCLDCPLEVYSDDHSSSDDDGANESWEEKVHKSFTDQVVKNVNVSVRVNPLEITINEEELNTVVTDSINN
jgi:phage shock protein PspC (stress-responsive transcriptional regulator)